MRSGLSYLAAVGACLLGMFIAHHEWGRLVMAAGAGYWLRALVLPSFRRCRLPCCAVKAKSGGEHGA